VSVVVAADDERDPPFAPVAHRLAPVFWVEVVPSSFTTVVTVAQFLVYLLDPVTPPFALLCRLPAAFRR